MKKPFFNWTHLAFNLREEARELSTRYFRRRPLIPILIFYSIVLIFFKQTGLMDRLSYYSPAHLSGLKGAITGVVTGHPDPRMTGCVYQVETESFETWDEDRKRTSLQGLLLLHVVRSTVPAATPGDRLRFIGRIQTPAPARIQGTFDYESYLENHGIHALVYTNSASLTNLGPSGRGAWLRQGWKVRQSVMAIFQRHLKEEEAAVLAGLVVGARPRFHPEIKRIFTESGTMHVLVASGSNVAFVAGLWFFVVHFLFRIPKKLSLLTALGPVWAYVIVVGSDAPILRAGVMASVALLAYLLMREDKPYHLLALAALMMLIVSPRSLFDVGFQMSFVTVFGLIHALPLMETRLQQQPFWRRWLFRLSCATFIAQLWLFPITTNVFRQFFPISLVSNIAILPVAALGFTAGLTLVLAEVVHVFLFPLGPLQTAIASAAGFYLKGLIAATAFFADHPGLILWLAPLNTAAVIGFYLCCLTVFRAKTSLLCRTGLVIGAVILAAGLISANKNSGKPAPLSATWIDVGRDLSCLLETADGKRVLINPGKSEPSNSSDRILLPLLATQHIRSLDAVVLTRANPDQISGLFSLCRGVSVGKIVINKHADERLWKLWIDENKSRLPQIVTMKEGAAMKWGQLEFRGLPDTKVGDKALLVRHGADVLLLDGVISLTTQDYLMSLKKKSLSLMQARFTPRIRWRPEFMKRFKPKIVVETGPGNSYRPSAPPWKEIVIKIPQQTGWWKWQSVAPAEASRSDINTMSGRTGRSGTGAQTPEIHGHVASSVAGFPPSRE